MQTTLAERLKEAMDGPPKITGRALAKACTVSAPSVSDWLNGATKSLDGVHLIRASEFLQVSAKWLAMGIGQKKPASATNEPSKTPRVTDGEGTAITPARLVLPPAQVLFALRRLLGAHSATRRQTCADLLARLAVAPDDGDVSAELEMLLHTPSVQTNDQQAA